MSLCDDCSRAPSHLISLVADWPDYLANTTYVECRDPHTGTPIYVGPAMYSDWRRPVIYRALGGGRFHRHLPIDRRQLQAVSSCNASTGTNPRKEPQMRTDSSIRDDVMVQIELCPVDANDIGVAVDGGIVTLSGHVPTFSQKVAVEDAVGNVKGVRGIAQEIGVRLAGSAGTSDDEIANRVANLLRWNAIVPAEKVHVKVHAAWVTLSGKVEWYFQKKGAEKAVRDLKGVRGLTNGIEVTPRVSTGDVRDSITKAPHRNAQLEAEHITASVEGSKVVLSGRVKAWNERKIAEEAVWAVPGVNTVVDNIAIG